jgi:hypothetical protein
MDKRYRGKARVQSVPRRAIYAILSTVLDKGTAKVISGYGEGTNPGMIDIAPYAGTVSEIREKLSNIPGLVSYLDQVSKLVQIRDEAMADGDRESALAAMREANKMQGYLAPLKLEVESRVKVTGAVMELKVLLGATGLTPTAVGKELERRRKVKEIELRGVPTADEVFSMKPEMVEVGR